jgi:hypothetical protein
MEKILTPEEKKYLRMVSNYLNSLGMKEGDINIELDNDAGSLDSDSINWEYVRHFDNNYTAEIPDGLYPILKKILDYSDNNADFNNDVDMLNYQSINVNIDCKDKIISVNHFYSYYGRGDGNTITWDEENDKELIDRFESLIENMPNDGQLTITYNGGGDSGYLEGDFIETGDGVPTEIEDWCYNELSVNFGGWEINEGSDGQFTFDFKNHTIHLDHTFNTEENESETLYEENFS